jgi:ribosomal-protein-alanine N-acetyltransferase
MNSELESKRLSGVPINSAHFGELRLLHSDPKVMATLSADGRPLAEADTRAWIESAVDHWRRRGYGIWIFFEQPSGEFVGYCGIKDTVVEGSDESELLYALRPRFWRNGMATEMAALVLGFAFEQARISNAIAFTLPTNRGSRRVMEKSGFIYERNIIHAGLPHVLYRRSTTDLALHRSK